MAANYRNPAHVNKTFHGKHRSKKELLNKYKKEEKYSWERVSSIFDASWKGKTFGESLNKSTE